MTSALTEDEMKANAEITRKLAASFIERSEALGYKGKKRDAAAMDYFAGAGMSAELAGNQPLGNHIARVMVFIVSVRGYAGVTEIANKAG